MIRVEVFGSSSRSIQTSAAPVVLANSNCKVPMDSPKARVWKRKKRIEALDIAPSTPGSSSCSLASSLCSTGIVVMARKADELPGYCAFRTSRSGSSPILAA
eukprot:6104562-Pleurochrysis_carterae.AAC.1